MSDNLSKESVLEVLRQVEDPEIQRSLVELNMIRDLEVSDGRVSFKIILTTPACPLKAKIEQDCRAALASLAGVKEVRIEFGADVKAGRIQSGRQPIEGVKNIVAVASGKGGVGKTTVAVNLSLALAETGARVGLMDADIYGPNIPLMLGLGDKKPEIDEEMLVPILHNGLKVMSIGVLVPQEKALVWRGPMLHGVLQQFLHQVRWAPLDYLIVDLPPGTGDAQLTMTQEVPLSGAVIVTTPQEVALADARKGINMFQEVDVTILGVVENMSYFACPHCGQQTEIFSSGGGSRSAQQFGVPFLGHIPLDLQIREGGDTGRPVVTARPESDISKIYREIAGQLAAQVSLASVKNEG